ncbi:MAG TPA: hypothetical protein VF972_10640 [Actinomycetota bacterium]
MGEEEHTESARTRSVLEPAFVQELGALPIEEVRRRRDLALEEREFQSYLRRLVQVRMDLLKAERVRRVEGSQSGPLVERITSALAEGPQGRGRGEALRLRPSDEDMAEAERRADQAMGGGFATPLDSLQDKELASALEGLERAEQTISSQRAKVLRVHDALQNELKRRYREDLSQVPVDL